MACLGVSRQLCGCLRHKRCDLDSTCRSNCWVALSLFNSFDLEIARSIFVSANAGDMQLVSMLSVMTQDDHCPLQCQGSRKAQATAVCTNAV